MRIIYRDKGYHIDRTAYTTFLKAQGFHDPAIAWLCIYVQHIGTDPDTLGEFRGPNTIFLYTQARPAEEVGHSLLHETRHYWQELEREQRRTDAYKQLKGRAFEKFLLAWLAEPGKRHEIDYWERPSEIDAYAFADEHHTTAQFVTATT